MCIIRAPRALAWWLGLMAPNEEVVGSIPHAGVVLTTLVHPTMVGGPWTLFVWVPQSPLGGYHVRYLQGTSGQLGTSIVCHYSVHPRKGRVVFVQMSPCPVGIGSLALRTDTLFTPAPC